MFSLVIRETSESQNGLNFTFQFTGKYHASNDIVVLFTNNPLQETIDKTVNIILNNNSNLKLITSQTHFFRR